MALNSHEELIVYHSIYLADKNMSAYRKKRSESLPTENDHRAQKLNQAADRFLNQQISKYEKEEKHLQRELLNLRRTRETLDAGIHLIMPSRARSSSEPFHGLSGGPRRNSGFSSHLSEKLPQIVPQSPVPPRKVVMTEDPFQLCQATGRGEASSGGRAHQASVKENKTCLLSVPDKQRLLRTYSNGSLSKISDKEVDSPIQVLISKSPLPTECIQDSSSWEEQDNEEAPIPDDVICANDENGRRRLRARSQGDIYSLTQQRFGCGDRSGSSLNPNLWVPSAPRSPKLRHGRLLIKTKKTNVDLMHGMTLTGKFKAVGHTAVGVAVLNRLNIKTPRAESFDEVMSEAGGKSPVPSPSLKRRGTLAHVNLVSSANTTNTSKQLKKKEDQISHQDQVDTEDSDPGQK